MSYLRTHPAGALILAGAIFVLAGFNLYRYFFEPPAPEAYIHYYQETAEQVRLVAADLPKDARITLMVMDGEYSSVNKTHMKKMVRALKRDGLNIQHVERLTVDPGEHWPMTSLGFPYNEFLSVAKAHPDTDAVISLCGPPVGIDPKTAPHPEDLSSLLLVVRVDDGLSNRLAIQLKNGFVQAAVVPRAYDPETAARFEPGSFDERFERVRSRDFR